jgi:hypothetical protein
VREWPTPTAQSYGTNQGGSAGRVGPVRPSLDTMARSNWATPIARDYRSEAETGFQGSPPLGRQVLTTPTAGASTSQPEAHPRLNPLFVAALLGLPCWWTAFDVSETPSSPRRRGRRSKSVQGGS